MWRWIFIMCLLGLYGNGLSQPITKEGDNERPTRQLDFRECCPCPPQTEAPSARMRDVDDCPCRFRSADSKPASSSTVPTAAVGTTGLVLQLAELKEDPKPLLQPEVDLASSVLQTLREATSEEYHEALERDAKRNEMKDAELSETLFKEEDNAEDGNSKELTGKIIAIIVNPNPEDMVADERDSKINTMNETESSESIFEDDDKDDLEDGDSEDTTEKIITIIVSPGQDDMEADAEPQASHIQESRCKHFPLSSTITKLGKMRAVPKSDIISVPKVKQSLFPRNSLDMDSDTGASNVEESNVSDGETIMSNNETKKIEPLLSTLRLFPNFSKTSSINNDDRQNENYNKSHIAGLRSPLLQNLLRNPLEISYPAFQSKKLSQHLIPKMKINNSDLARENDKKEQFTEKFNNWLRGVSNFSMKSNLENMLDNSKPFDLKNLWKLKDVELIPPKVVKSSDPNENGPRKLMERDSEITSVPDIQRKDSNPDKNIDAITLSDYIVKVNNQAKPNIKLTTRVLDTIPNASHMHANKDKFENDTNKCEGDSLTESVEQTFLPPKTPMFRDGRNLIINNPQQVIVQSIVRDYENEQPNNVPKQEPINEINTQRDTFDMGDDENETNENVSDSNSSESTFQNDDGTIDQIKEDKCKGNSEEDNNVPAESSIQQTVQSPTPGSQNTVGLSDSQKYLQLDNTLSKIKENMKKRLRKINKGSSNRESSESDSKPQTNVVIRTSDPNCLESKVNQLQTAVKPNILNSVEQKPSNCSDTVQKLQKLPDPFLQKEKGLSKFRTVSCHSKSTEFNDPKDVPDTQSNLNSENIIDPAGQEAVNILTSDSQDNSGSCARALTSSKSVTAQTEKLHKKDLIEMEPVASNVVPQQMKPLFQSRHKTLEIPAFENLKFPTTIGNLDLLKQPILNLDPLPIFDDFKLKLSNLFNVDDKEIIEPIGILEKNIDPKFVMASDASTSNHWTRFSPFKITPTEHLKPDSIQLKPPASLLGLAPKISEDDLGQRVSEAFDNIMDDFKVHLRNTQESLKLPNTLNDHFRSSMVSTDISDRLKLHTENALKNIQEKFKATGDSLSFIEPLSKPSPTFFSNLHESVDDINENIRTIHNNLKERLDLIHNPSNRQTQYSNIDTIKIKTRPLGNPSSVLGEQLHKKLHTTKKWPSRPDIGEKLKLGSSQPLVKNKFKMPPTTIKIPKTIDVPDLKTITNNPSTKIRKSSNLRPYLPSSSKGLESPTNKQVNPFKNSKFKVSFSTTSRPRTIQSFKSKYELNTPAPSTLKDRIKGKLGKIEDSTGALSEKQNEIINKPWPHVTEPHFLPKVKEAMRARLPKVNSKTSDQADIPFHSDYDGEMLKSASQNFENLESLKENVSYKCKMVCTRA